MLKELFINLIILHSFISIRFQVLNHQLEPKIRWDILKPAPRIISYSILGMLLIFFRIFITHSIVVDFSDISVILASIYDGTPAVILTCLIISVTRVLFFGFSISAVTEIVSTVFIGASCIIISRLDISVPKKWISSVLLSILIDNLAFILLTKHQPLIRWEILLAFWLGAIPSALLAYYYIRHLQKINKIVQTLEQESVTDFLTGLNNCRSFERLFNYAVQTAVEEEESLSLLMIDIDFFKRINDTYGHQKGDLVLKELARVLMRNCRSFGMVSRNGGEEFSIILLDCSASQAMLIAERIRASIEAHEFKLSKGQKIRLTISIGVAIYPDTTKKIGYLIEKADAALYEAKRTGRNKVTLAK